MGRSASTTEIVLIILSGLKPCISIKLTCVIKNKPKLTCRITLLVKTRDLSPPATFDGLLPIGITTKSINDFLMTG